MAITVTKGGGRGGYGTDWHSAIPGGGSRQCWWCSLERGHSGLHEAHECCDDNFYTWSDDDAAETMMLIALGLK